MSRGTLGSFDGAVTPGINMVSDVFRANEIKAHPNSHLKFGVMTLRKIGITTEPNTVVHINGSKIPIPSGVFELAMEMIGITKLVFEAPVSAMIYYIY
jgi:hypothetical protein